MAMLAKHEAAITAKRDALDIAEHVRYDLAHNEELQNVKTPYVYHYIVCGTHVDPDGGREYVPLDKPLISYQKRKISRRNTKVRQLVDWVVTSLVGGKAGVDVQAELNARQAFDAVSLALCFTELEILLAGLYANDYCAPGCLDGGYFNLISPNVILYGWEEALPCQGGVTDRYCSAELERERRK